MQDPYLRTEATGTVDNKSFGPLACFIGVPTVVDAANATTLTITGIADDGNKPIHGQQLWIMSTGAGAVALANQDSGSQAHHRILTGTGTTITLSAGTGRVLLVYDNSAERWRVLVSSAASGAPGTFISPAFNAADFTATGSMTWTLQSGDVQTFAYAVNGKVMHVVYALFLTTVGGTVSSGLQIKIPGGFTAAKDVYATGLYNDNGGTETVGSIFVQTAGTQIQLLKIANANWTLSTNGTNVRGEIFFEVQ